MILFTCLVGGAYAADGTTHILGAKKVALDASTETVMAGYYSTTTLSAVDPDLKAENIAVSTTIFGITGTYAGAGGGSSHELPDTGQTTSFATTFTDDAGIVSGAQLSYSSSTINGDAVTIDNRTGLMWAQDGSAAGCNSGTGTDWETAGAYCQGLQGASSFAGYSDWRLPNIRELMSIVNYENQRPAIDPTYFPNTVSDYYWSSTTYVPDSGLAWIVRFYNGAVDAGYKGGNNYVRCVRAGP